MATTTTAPHYFDVNKCVRPSVWLAGVNYDSKQADKISNLETLKLEIFFLPPPQTPTHKI